MEEVTCPYSYDVIEGLNGKNVTAEDAAKWPCDVRMCWMEVRPLVTLVRWLLSYGTAIVIATGLFLNTLSLIVLTRKRMRKKNANLYLAFLAVYDNCTLTFNFLVGVLRGNNETVGELFQNNVGLCISHAVAIELFNSLSVWIIVTFTVERFLMVRFPIKSRKWSPKRTLIAISIVSSIITSLSFHKIFYTGFEGDSVYGYKPCKTKRKLSGPVIYSHIAIKTWIPTILIVTLNIFIMIEIIRNQSKRKNLVQTVITHTDEKITRLLVIVSSVYVLFVLPTGIIQTAEVVWHVIKMVPPGNPTYSEFMITKIKMKWARAFVFFFYQFNFTINFFLYVASSKLTRFRANLKKVVGLGSSVISTKDNGTSKSKSKTTFTVQTTKIAGDQHCQKNNHNCSSSTNKTADSTTQS